jgi:hypothetical protein
MVLSLALLAPSLASAADTPYCRRAQARAASDAALLLWPRLIVQGIRFPASGQVDLSPTVGQGYQGRVGLAFSPLDLYRGVRVLQIADADCEQQDAGERLRELLARGIDVARLAALVEQGSYLDAHRDQWRALAAKAQERLAARVITLVEFDELRRHADELERRLVQVHGDAHQLQARGTDLSGEPLGLLARRYVEQSTRFDRQTSHLRTLDAIEFQVSAGLIPRSPVDWYGIAEVSINLGGIARAKKEQTYLAARTDELHHARYELDAQAEDLRKQVAAALEQTRQDREVIERTLAFIATSRHALAQSEAPNIAHARDTLAIEQISLDSERVFLSAFVGPLSALLEDRHVH